MLLEEMLGRAEPVGVGLSWLRGAAGFCVLEGLLPLPQPDPSRELEGFSSCYPWDLIGGRAKRNGKSRARGRMGIGAPRGGPWIPRSGGWEVLDSSLDGTK